MSELQSFRLFLIQKGMALATVKKNVDCMRSLLNRIPDLKKESLDQFFISHLEAGKSKAYLNIVISTLHWWGKYKEDDSYKQFRYFNVGETHKAIMSDEEIEAFLSLPYPNTSNRGAKEDYEVQTLFFRCLAFSGARPDEMAQMTIDRVDLGSRAFILDKTKTTPRSVPIAHSLIHDLTDYIKNLEGELLFTKNGRAFTKGMWQSYFDLRIKRLGIKRKKLSTYSLRHSFITRNLDAGANLYGLQNVIGHKQGSPITAQYYHYANKIGQTIMKRDPLSRTSLPYYDRLKIVREGFLKLLEDNAHSPEEEKNMLNSILNFNQTLLEQ